MSRGPRIRQDEVDTAHKLKAEGKSVKAIALELKRSMGAVAKMLLLNKSDEQQTESLPS